MPLFTNYLTISRDKKKREEIKLKDVGLSSFMLSYLFYELFVGQ